MQLYCWAWPDLHCHAPSLGVAFQVQAICGMHLSMHVDHQLIWQSNVSSLFCRQHDKHVQSCQPWHPLCSLGSHDQIACHGLNMCVPLHLQAVSRRAAEPRVWPMRRGAACGAEHCSGSLCHVRPGGPTIRGASQPVVLCCLARHAGLYPELGHLSMLAQQASIHAVDMVRCLSSSVRVVPAHHTSINY